MAHRKLASFQRHANLIRAARNWYESHGYARIFADVPGIRPPRSIHIAGSEPSRPDLTCRDARNKLVVVEAETCDTLDLPETASQWRLFRQYADAAGGEFHLVVPEECAPAAQRRLQVLGIRADHVLAL
ncbi:MAG: hypothetical protein QN163_07355 [Armatimonadota bacterium]|nr:hypothetical protein [Armatimonadota bacterium]MDR5696977.1 hypothetical protein [Armatimonadota bacterium]